jgi:hypothetical protein
MTGQDRTAARLHALAIGNGYRHDDKQLCALIRSAGPRGGARYAADIIYARSARIRVRRVIGAVPWIGEVTLEDMLDMADVRRKARVSEIPPRKAEYLAGLLIRHAERPWKDSP